MSNKEIKLLFLKEIEDWLVFIKYLDEEVWVDMITKNQAIASLDRVLAKRKV